MGDQLQQYCFPYPGTLTNVPSYPSSANAPPYPGTTSNVPPYTSALANVPPYPSAANAPPYPSTTSNVPPYPSTAVPPPSRSSAQMISSMTSDVRHNTVVPTRYQTVVRSRPISCIIYL